MGHTFARLEVSYLFHPGWGTQLRDRGAHDRLTWAVEGSHAGAVIAGTQSANSRSLRLLGFLSFGSN